MKLKIIGVYFNDESIVMTKLYWSSFNEKLDDDIFKYYLDSLPIGLRIKISRFKRWEDAHASLYGKLLLKLGLKELGLESDLGNLKYNSYKRPYINEVDFNISHSGNCVACAFSTLGRIGVDLEEVKLIELSCFESQFTSQEWRTIMNSEQQLDSFYHYWTAKEAIIKGEGKGLNISIKNILHKENSKQPSWYLKRVELRSNYILHLATEYEIEETTFFQKLVSFSIS